MGMTYKVNPQADIEVVNFDEKTSWIRWMLPDWSDNGNIDLPSGNWKIVSRVGEDVTVESI